MFGKCSGLRGRRCGRRRVPGRHTKVSQVNKWKIVALVLAAVVVAVAVPLGLRKLKEEQEHEPEVGAY